MTDEQRAFVNEALIGMRAQLRQLANTIGEILEVVNAAPPEDEQQQDRPRTFGRRDNAKE